MNTTTARHVCRLAIGLGVVWGIAGCDGAGAAGDPPDETDNSLANGRPAGGVGVVNIEISDLKTDRNGIFGIEQCTGTMISGNRILTAGHCADFLTIKDGHDTTVLLQGNLFGRVNYTEDGTNWVCLTNTAESICSDASWVPVHVSRLGNVAFPPDIALVRFASPLPGVRSAELRRLSTASVRVKQSVEEWGAGFSSADGTSGSHISPAMMRAVVRITAVGTTTFRVSDATARACGGDSGGPLFAGPSDLVVGIASTTATDARGFCAATTAQTVAHRITPAVITFINNNRAGSDPLCHETIAGTGFFSCS